MKPVLQRFTTSFSPIVGTALGWFRDIWRRVNWWYIFASACVLVLGYMLVFFWPASVVFSYNQAQTCFTNPMFLPGLIRAEPSDNFTITPINSFSIAGFPLYSHSTCVQAAKAPKAKSSEIAHLAPLNNSWFKKQVTIMSGELPSLAAAPKFDKPVATSEQLHFSLNQPDKTFAYQLVANDTATRCNKQDATISCNVAALKLAQATTYELKLERTFNDQPVETVLVQPITTVEPVQIIQTSIASGETIHGIPTEVFLVFNKPLAKTGTLRLQMTDGTPQDIAIEVTTDSATVKARFVEPLPRSANFTLSLESAEAQDHGYMPAPYSLNFKTSGGPKVVGISLGSYKVQPGKSFTITFDSALQTGQPLQNVISVESGGPVAATITARGSVVTVTPATLNRCTPFTVKVSNGIKNEAGVSGGSAWQFSSRTLCQSTFSIGASVQGRGITAYRFGSGASVVMFIGTVHGDEKSAANTLYSWIDQLESNPTRIPAHRTLIIIPVANPDGYAAGKRTNANTVDLNRNFPANNWKSGVTMPTGEYLENGGGTAALSEPESSALANYILSQNPRLVLTYHAVAGVVLANESGDSRALATKYGNLAGMPSGGNDYGGFSHYDTTGALEDWLHDKYGIPAILIEQYTKTGNEFVRQREAMWAMVNL